MSETKNVVIQQNNGTDYDKLHPETVDDKVNLTDDNVSVWGNTLKDALPKIDSRLTVTENNQWEIGDIRQTAKNDLGEKWLLCNGVEIDSSDEYSRLGDVLGKEAGKWSLKNTFQIENIFGFSVNNFKINYSNGKYLIVTTEKDGDNASVWLAFSDSMAGPWTTKQIISEKSEGLEQIYFNNRSCEYNSNENCYYLLVVRGNTGSISNPGAFQVFSSIDLSQWTKKYTSKEYPFVCLVTNLKMAGDDMVSVAVSCDIRDNNPSQSIMALEYINGVWKETNIYTIYNFDADHSHLNLNVVNNIPFVSMVSQEASNYESTYGYGFRYTIIWRHETSKLWKYQKIDETTYKGATISNVIWKDNQFCAIATRSTDGQTSWAPVLLTKSYETSNTWTEKSLTTSRTTGGPFYILQTNNGDLYYFYQDASVQKSLNLNSRLSQGETIHGLNQLDLYSIVDVGNKTIYANKFVECKLMEFTSILPNISVDRGYAYIKALN